MYVGVICKREGFRRAGRAWPAGPSVAEVTEEGFEQLKADSTFEVQEISEEQFKAATQVSVDLAIQGDGTASETAGDNDTTGESAGESPRVSAGRTRGAARSAGESAS